jgi:hypothetical protein
LLVSGLLGSGLLGVLGGGRCLCRRLRFSGVSHDRVFHDDVGLGR